MSDKLVIVSLLTVITLGKIWLELFEDIIFFIPIHIFFNVFLKKSGKIKLFTFLNSVD